MPADLLTVREFATRENVSVQRVRQWIYEGRIPGTSKNGRDWAIPKSAKRPERKK